MPKTKQIVILKGITYKRVVAKCDLSCSGCAAFGKPDSLILCHKLNRLFREAMGRGCFMEGREQNSRIYKVVK